MIIHPVLLVERDAEGNLTEILSPHATSGTPESVIHVEVARHTDEDELDELHGHVNRVLDEVRAVVEDWQTMRQKALDIADELKTAPGPISDDDASEAKAFMEWLADDHFTFLGAREYV